MHMRIVWGRQQHELDVPEKNLVQPHRPAMPGVLADPVQAMRDALETPLAFPPLRRALTPADHVAIVVDETIPQMLPLLVALLEHLQEASISADAITLICLPPSSGQ